MKLGIIGKPNSGRTTVFETLTRNFITPDKIAENHIGMVKVPDNRLDVLIDMHKPKKETYAQVAYFLPGKLEQSKDIFTLNQLRECDAYLLVLRNYVGSGLDDPQPYQDFISLEQDMILADMAVVEKRVETLRTEKQRGKKVNPEELTIMESALAILENEKPLRSDKNLASQQLIRGFTLVSAKPMLVLFNNTDDDDVLPEVTDLTSNEDCLVIRGKLEQELAQMSAEDAADFLAEYQITESAMDRVIRRSYQRLGLISFFTIGEDEVKAWTIKDSTIALDAAGEIHSDIQRGFIRAEVIHYDDLMEAGDIQNARKKGTLRLEGKTYPVKDGDIINFRFNV
jgi:ribosome-binding ATPase